MSSQGLSFGDGFDVGQEQESEADNNVGREVLEDAGQEQEKSSFQYEKPMAGLTMLRVMGTALTLLAMIQTYFGLQAFLFKTNADIGDYKFVGCFWVGLYLLIPGIYGMRVKGRNDAFKCLLANFVGIVASFSGVAVDGSALAVYDSMEACGRLPNTFPKDFSTFLTVEDVVVTGNSSYATAARYCAYYLPDYECVCTADIMDPVLGPAPRCYGFNYGGGGTMQTHLHSCQLIFHACFILRLTIIDEFCISNFVANQNKENCAHVLTEYPQILDASFGVCLVALPFVFLFSVLLTITLLCPTVLERGNDISANCHRKLCIRDIHE